MLWEGWGPGSRECQDCRGPPPSLHPRPGCGLSLGAPPLPAGAGSAGVARPCSRRRTAERLLVSESGSAGFGSSFAGISGRFFPLPWAPVSSSVKWASTFSGGVRTETVCDVEHVPGSVTGVLALANMRFPLPFLLPLASSTHFLRALGRLGSRDDSRLKASRTISISLAPDFRPQRLGDGGPAASMAPAFMGF